MWVVVRLLFDEEVSNYTDTVEAYGLYASRDEADAKVVELCNDNRRERLFDEADFEDSCHVIKIRQ